MTRAVDSLLAQGDRRSIGRVAEVVELLRTHTGHLPAVVACLFDPNACIRMRAADALEKVSREQPSLLQPYKAQLLHLSAETKQKELRWHLAVIIPRLRLTATECTSAAALFQSYLEDRSSLVKTFALQGLADLPQQDANLQPTVVDLLRVLVRSGTPAMRARARILLKRLEAE